MTYRKQLDMKAIDKTGDVEALIATYDVIDKDGDVTVPGFFGEQPVSIVTSHNWGDLMLGKGVIRDDDRGAIFAGRFNLDDPDAAKLHSKLRFDLDHPPALIEWSYAFDILEGGAEKGDRDGRPVRYLRPLPDGSPGSKVFEVSPVLVGAGEGTGTLAIKTSPTGLKFSEHIESVMTDIETLLARAEDIKQLRTDNGKDIGSEARDLLSRFDDTIIRLKTVLTVEHDDDDDVSSPEWLKIAQTQFEFLQRDLQMT